MKNRFLYLTLLFIFLDLVITLLFWQYEKNPIVIDLGKLYFSIAKLISILVVMIAYKSIENWSKLASNIALLPIFLLHFVVILLNVMIVLQ